MDIIVIGGGVSGLTTGVSLLGAAQAIPALAFLEAPRERHRVSIWAAQLSPDTTSDVAGALWEPYLAGPADKVKQWGAVAYRCFQALQAVPESGVIRRTVLAALTSALADADVPEWTAFVDGFRRATGEELPPSYADGYVYDSFVTDMSAYYLPFLQRAFTALGGTLERRTVSDVAEAFARADVVVNCSGLGSRTLFADAAVYPVRGQVVRIKPRGVARVVVAEQVPDGLPGEMAYVIPRITDIALGGVADAGNASTAIDTAQTQAIIRRCQQLVPALGAIAPDDILTVACGLRPGRQEVRVAAVAYAPGRCLVHNYGHGGAGVTLSWGCAEEVVRLVNAPVA